jgi:hypothetical protein
MRGRVQNKFIGSLKARSSSTLVLPTPPQHHHSRNPPDAEFLAVYCFQPLEGFPSLKFQRSAVRKGRRLREGRGSQGNRSVTILTRTTVVELMTTEFIGEPDARLDTLYTYGDT